MVLVPFVSKQPEPGGQAMPEENPLSVVYDITESRFFDYDDPTSLNMVREVLEKAGCTGPFRLSHGRGVPGTGFRNGIQSIRYKRNAIWITIQPDNKKDYRYEAILIPPHDSNREEIAKKLNAAFSELRQNGKKPKEHRADAVQNGAALSSDIQTPPSNPDIAAVGPPDPELELLQEHDEIDTHILTLREAATQLNTQVIEAMERLKDADARKFSATQRECSKRREIAALQEQINKLLADIRPDLAVQEEQARLRQLAQRDLGALNLRRDALAQSESALRERQQSIAAEIAVYDESRRQLRLREAEHRLHHTLTDCNLEGPEQISALRALLARLEMPAEITAEVQPSN
jgi:hypothetical protein